MNIHEKYMLRCLQIAKNAIGNAAPNPAVGCVIVVNNRIIGEGCTSAYGGSHAEVNAIKAVQDKDLLKKATLYVSLEPCSHYGKTPPCSHAIVEHQIPKVVIGCGDSNSLVAGQGIAYLKAHKVEVIENVLYDQCRNSLKRFFTFHELNRPYIILKWAMSKDGYLAPLKKERKRPFWLTNRYSQQLTHKWRSEEQAILIGVQTAEDDNASLTTRHWHGKNPVRVIVDPNNRATKKQNIFDNQAKTIHLTAKALGSVASVESICQVLYEHKITSVIVEGGKFTLERFIESNLWDEARVFQTTRIIDEGLEAPYINAHISQRLQLLDDTLTTYENH